MLKGQLFQFLNRYLEEYLYGFNPDQLRLAILNGNIKLKNLTFRPDKINDHLLMMRSPVLLKAGIIGNITIDVNYIDWSKTEVILEDLLIILGPNFSELKTRKKDYVSNEEKFVILSNRLDEYSRQGFDSSDDPDRRGLDMHHVMGHEKELDRLYRETRAQQGTNGTQPKKPTLKETFENIKANLPEGEKDIFSLIFGHDMFAGLLTTLRFVAKNIHIRYEDDQLVPRHPISFGFLIESILLHPNPNMDIYIPSSKDSQALGYYNTEKKVLDDFWKTSKERKNLVQQLIINNVEIYLNSASEMYIPFSLYEETLCSPNGIFEAIPPLELKALMKQYLEHDDIYKFTLFKIERIELHYMISSNMKPEPHRQNFVLLNSTMFNVYFNIKPNIIEDLLDVVNYFQHFVMWKHFEKFKPSIRPILSARLVNSKPAAQRMRRIVLREWWRSILWYLRVKKLIDEGREDTIPELYEEYCKSSWIKILDDYRLRSRDISVRDYSSVGPGGSFLDQASSKKIFHEEEPKLRESKSLQEKFQSKEVKNALDKMKNILIMLFCNIYNVNVALKKNNGKTFLLMRIDQSHISAMKNHDFKDSNLLTFQVNNIRLFLCQSEKQKKIFEANAQKEAQDMFKSASLPKTKQNPLINQDLQDIQKVMGRSSTTVKRGIPFNEPLPKGPIPKDSPNLGSLANYKPNPYAQSPLENYPSERTPMNYNPIWQQGNNLGSDLKKKLEDELKKSSAKPSTDLLLLELPNDIILKLEVKPSAGQGIQFQVKMEINEINVNLDSEILISIFEYINEINKIYYIRTRQTTFEEDLENIKYQAQKQVLTFQHSMGLSTANQTISPNRSGVLVRDDDIIKRSMTSQPQPEPQRGSIRKGYTMQPSANVNALRSDQEIRPMGMGSQLTFDNTELFLTKLSEFLEANEFLFSLNMDGFNVTLTENSHTLDSRADLMNIQVPKGKVNLSFNFNKKSAYIVDVYGFRIETSSKFKALHFLAKKVKGILESGIEEDEKNIFFYDFLLKKEVLKNNMSTDDFKRYYAQLKGNYPM